MMPSSAQSGELIPRLALRFATGLAASGAISLAAHRARALSSGGAVAALPVGSAVFAGAGLRGSATLIAYFASSSLLGRLPGGTALEQRRGSERDAVQVLANGAIPAILALLVPMVDSRLRPLLLAGFGGAIAAATADTWATEVGSRLGRVPRSIIGFHPVPTGTSGGVTIAGLGASAAGSASIAVVATIGQPVESGSQPSSSALVALGGLAGALVDSLLGATLQEVRVCTSCMQESELLIHGCGLPTQHARGQAWCTNDVVNSLAIIAGAAVSIVATAIDSGRLGATAPRHARGITPAARPYSGTRV